MCDKMIGIAAVDFDLDGGVTDHLFKRIAIVARVFVRSEEAAGQQWGPVSRMPCRSVDG